MGTTNQRKTIALGMPRGRARHVLIKQLLLHMAQQLGWDNCYRCKKKIETIESLSIEHKKAWFLSDNPKELYWDLDNIAFSHLSCNIGHSNAGRTLLKRK